MAASNEWQKRLDEWLSSVEEVWKDYPYARTTINGESENRRIERALSMSATAIGLYSDKTKYNLIPWWNHIHRLRKSRGASKPLETLPDDPLSGVRAENKLLRELCLTVDIIPEDAIFAYRESKRVDQGRTLLTECRSICQSAASR